MYQVYHNTLPDQLTALFETRNSDNLFIYLFIYYNLMAYLHEKEEKK